MYTLPILTVAQASFQCPVCYCLYTDPVCLPCSHTFCRECILRCLQTRPQCPLCNGPVNNAKRLLTPLPTLAALSTLVRAAAKDGADYASSSSTLSTGAPVEAHTRASCSGHGERDDASKSESDAFAQWFTATTIATTATVAAVAAAGPSHPLPLAMDGLLVPLTAPSTQPLAPAEPLSTAQTTAAAVSFISAAPPTLRLDEADGGDAFERLLAAEVTTHDSSTTPQLDRTAGRSRQGADRFVCSPAQPAPSPPPPPPCFAPSDVDVEAPLTITSGLCTVTLQPPLGRVRLSAVARALSRPPTAHALSLTAVRVALDEAYRRGACALCGLDVAGTHAMRGFLFTLLSERAEASGCTAAELSTVTEESLSHDLGPLWSVSCALESGATADGAGNGDGLSSSPAACVVAHQNCLAWCGAVDPALLPYYRGGSHLCTVSDATLVREALTRSPSTTTTSPLTQHVRQGTLEYPHIHLSTPPPPLVLETATANTSTPRPTPTKRKRGRPPATSDAVVAAPPPSTAAPTASQASALTRLALLVINGVATTLESAATTDPAQTPLCTICGRPSRFGASLRACTAPSLDPRHPQSCGRVYHLPCALLAGADRCLVFGLDDDDDDDDDSGELVNQPAQSTARSPPPAVTLWCGPCYRKRGH